MVNARAVSILLECIPVYYFVRTVKQKSHWPNISLIDTYYIIKVICYYHIAKLNKLSSITFTARKRSCEKVMFLQVTVILLGGGGIPACITGHMTNQHYISSCIGVKSQLVLGQHTGNIKRILLECILVIIVSLY